MGEKKRPGRFTIQFSQKDPQQRMVTEILEEKGRQKAQFITNAVLQYSQSAASSTPLRSIPGLDEERLEQIILSVIKKHPQFAAPALGNCDIPKDPAGESEATAAPWDTMGDDPAMAAITNTLAAFRHK